MWSRLGARICGSTTARLALQRRLIVDDAVSRRVPGLARRAVGLNAVQATSSYLARQGGLVRPFCIDAASPTGEEGRPKKKAARRKLGAESAKALGVVFVVGGIAYAVSQDAREVIDDAFEKTIEVFEDFNDASREFFESIGDRLVSKNQGPWLLELETMKYPEHIPTLILDLDKVILRLEHDSRQGWHVVKRPFADQFFKEISHYYEVVLFSDDVFPVALDIATKWNLPVTGVLHRDFCKKKRNHYVKDLSKLGRKLERVIMIDHDPAAFQLQPDNAILIKPFDGDTNDSELADLLEFLKAAATSNQTADIRDFVNKFRGEDVTSDYDIGRRYLLYKQEQDQKVEQRRSVGKYFSASRSFPNQQGGGGGSRGGMNAFPR